MGGVAQQEGGVVGRAEEVDAAAAIGISKKSAVVIIVVVVAVSPLPARVTRLWCCP